MAPYDIHDADDEMVAASGETIEVESEGEDDVAEVAGEAVCVDGSMDASKPAHEGTSNPASPSKLTDAIRRNRGRDSATPAEWHRERALLERDADSARVEKEGAMRRERSLKASLSLKQRIHRTDEDLMRSKMQQLADKITTLQREVHTKDQDLVTERSKWKGAEQELLEVRLEYWDWKDQVEVAKINTSDKTRLEQIEKKLSTVGPSKWPNLESEWQKGEHGKTEKRSQRAESNGRSEDELRDTEVRARSGERSESEAQEEGRSNGGEAGPALHTQYLEERANSTEAIDAWIKRRTSISPLAPSHTAAMRTDQMSSPQHSNGHHAATSEHSHGMGPGRIRQSPHEQQQVVIPIDIGAHLQGLRLSAVGNASVEIVNTPDPCEVESLVSAPPYLRERNSSVAGMSATTATTATATPHNSALRGATRPALEDRFAATAPPHTTVHPHHTSRYPRLEATTRDGVRYWNASFRPSTEGQYAAAVQGCMDYQNRQHRARLSSGLRAAVPTPAPEVMTTSRLTTTPKKQRRRQQQHVTVSEPPSFLGTPMAVPPTGAARFSPKKHTAHRQLLH